MLNGINPWGNGNLVPLGPLREPLVALERADIAVIHHVDLVRQHICFLYFDDLNIEVSVVVDHCR